MRRVLKRTISDKWLLVLVSGLSLFFVLFIFRGYGIEGGNSRSGHGLFARAVLFGLCTSAIFYLVEFPLNRIAHFKNKWLNYLLEILLGSTATFLLFNYFWQWTEWTAEAYLLILFEYCCVMIIPFTIVGFFNREGKNTKATLIKLESENGRHCVELRPDKLLYLKSEGNYVEVFYSTDDGVRSELIRNSLSHLERSLAGFSQIKRCHRSYLVNLHRVDQSRIKNNKMELRIGSARVAVSSKYASDFR